MSRSRVLVASVAISMMAAVPTQADSRSTTYVATQELGVYYENRPLGIGGQIFSVESKLLSIKVDDRNGVGVQVSACQRHTDSGQGDICGRTGDVELSFCSTAEARDVSTEDFKPGYFVVRVDTTSPNCPTLGTTGTITVGW